MFFPDMTPPEFDLSSERKERLQDIRFEDIDSLETEMAIQIKSAYVSCHATEISTLPPRWTSLERAKIVTFCEL